MTDRLHALASEVLAAAQAGRPIPLLSTRPQGLSMAEAYTVARHLHQGHLALGHRLVGRKLGLTYPAGWPAGITAPLWAPLYAHTVQLLPSHEATVAMGAWVAPKLEPEVVFRLRHAPRSAALADVWGSIDAVAHGLEIVTSPFPDWAHSPADSVATGACHAALLVAPWQPLPSLGAWAAEIQARAVGSCGAWQGAREAHGRPLQRARNAARRRKSLRPSGLGRIGGPFVVATLARTHSASGALRLDCSPNPSQRGPGFLPPTLLGADPVAALAQFSVNMVCDGQQRAIGTPERVMGSPLRALMALVDLLAQQPDAPPLRAGEIITTGTLCAAEPFAIGQQWQTQFEGLGLDGLSMQCVP